VYCKRPLQVIRQGPGFIAEVLLYLAAVLLNQATAEQKRQGQKNQKDDQRKSRAHGGAHEHFYGRIGFFHVGLRNLSKYRGFWLLLSMMSG